MAIFPSTLIVSRSPDVDTFINQLDTGEPDILTISENHSIEQVRQVKQFLSQKAYSYLNKLVIIHHAELLNTESQNALLKTLEEPGPNNYIILTTSKKEALLPTIISRCFIVKQSGPATDTAPLSFPREISDCLLLSDKLSADKESLPAYIESQEIAYQKTLVTNPSNSNIIKGLILASRMLHANVDSKSTLDYLFLTNLDSSSSLH